MSRSLAVILTHFARLDRSAHWESLGPSTGGHRQGASFTQEYRRYKLATQPSPLEQTYICWHRGARAPGGGSSKKPAKPRSQSERAWTTAGGAGATPASSPQTWRQLQSNRTSQFNGGFISSVDDWGACSPRCSKVTEGCVSICSVTRWSRFQPLAVISCHHMTSQNGSDGEKSTSLQCHETQSLFLAARQGTSRVQATWLHVI